MASCSTIGITKPTPVHRMHSAAFISPGTKFPPLMHRQVNRARITRRCSNWIQKPPVSSLHTLHAVTVILLLLCYDVLPSIIAFFSARRSNISYLIIYTYAMFISYSSPVCLCITLCIHRICGRAM